MQCIFSIDVEDWFHVLDVAEAPKPSEWHYQESRVEYNFLQLLDILSEYNVKSTCFFLGWIAEQFPHLVKEAQSRGHAVASHSFAHKLVYEPSPNGLH